MQTGDCPLFCGGADTGAAVVSGAASGGKAVVTSVAGVGQAVATGAADTVVGARGADSVHRFSIKINGFLWIFMISKGVNSGKLT